MARHPWAMRRARLNLTQLSVSQHMNVSRHYIIRLEQGLFHTPSDFVLSVLSELYDCPREDLLNEYQQYVKLTREEFKNKYTPFNKILWGYNGIQHPLVFYREYCNLSQIGFCKGLCLHPDPIADWEQNEQRGVPRELILACNEIGWDYGPLENAVVEWRLSGRYKHAS